MENLLHLSACPCWTHIWSSYWIRLHLKEKRFNGSWFELNNSEVDDLVHMPGLYSRMMRDRYEKHAKIIWFFIIYLSVCVCVFTCPILKNVYLDSNYIFVHALIWNMNTLCECVFGKLSLWELYETSVFLFSQIILI